MAQLSSPDNVGVIHHITCRIETPYRTGTGVLLKTEQSNFYYLLTAKHCLLEKDSTDIVSVTDVTIYIPDPTNEEFYQFMLDESDSILFPKEDVDGALIVFRKHLHFEVPMVELSEIRYTIEECLFRGYPQAYGSIKGVTIDQVRYSDNNIITTSRNLSTIESDPLYNCQGFSGSGVFCELGGQLFLVGLVYKLEEPFQLFSVTDLTFLRGLLSSHDLPELQLLSFTLGQTVLDDVEKLKQKTQLVLDGINNRLGNSFFVERNSIDDDFNAKFATNRLIVIKGEAGVGKSAYAKAIIHRLVDSNYSIFAVKADSLARDSIEDVFPNIHFDLYAIFYQLGLEKQVAVLIDSFEKLLEVDNFEAIKELLRLCKSLPNIKIIITCRTFAYQQLLFELYNDFPQFDFVDVPPFNDTELTKVETAFPFLAELLEVEKYKQILRKPFYLNLVIRHWELFKDKQFLTEKEVRRTIWENVITKNDVKRARIFEEIALSRAKSMSLYARINDPDPVIINQLHSDGIIDIEDNLMETFSPAHDIFEDIALIRFVERVFQSTQYPKEFFNNLEGKEPAIRRAFRLWVSDQLLLVSNQFALFLTQILNFLENEVEAYWKDELLIAVLRSEYCDNFIQTNSELLKENNYKLFLRLVHLLKTTCQEPDEKLVQTVRERTKSSYWIYLRPVGPGWEAILCYIYNNLDKLKDYYRLIFVLITSDWSKKLNQNTNSDLLVEAKYVGNILLTILREIKTNLSNQRDSFYSTKDIDSLLQVLFKLVSIFDIEIRNMIEDADSYPKRGSENSHLINFNLREFYDSVIDHTLSGLHSKDVCKELPDLVSKVAINSWLRDEYGEKVYDPFGYASESPFDIGRDFGLARNTELHNFPAGIYKTPIRFLLYFHPSKALNLIVTVINHATDAYAKSERGKASNIVNVAIYNHDGSIVQQKGNTVLWGMYRGMVEATHDLLQSILMSLENWLFELCVNKSDWTDNLLEYTYQYLLKASKSVATTSVLASVAMAYPGRIGKLCFPILKVKEFYSWDIQRLVGDHHPLAPLDNEIPFAQEERHRSNQLPHRKFRLENIVTKLQIEGYWDEINLILDKFISTADPDDITWKLALNRMDIRKFEIDETEETLEESQIIVKPKIDQELVEIVSEAQDQHELTNKAAYIATWSRSVFEGKDDVDNTFAKWQNEYQSYRELTNLDEDFIKPFECPNYLAAIGIKIFSSSLSDEEENWCIDTITTILEKAIQEKLQDYPQTWIFLEPAIQTIPLILSLEISEEKRMEIKEIIFLSLLFLNLHKMEYPYESIRRNLWSLDYAFANSCLAGMIEYAKIHKARKFYTPQSEEKKEYWLKHLHKVQKLTDRVCKNEVELNIDGLSFDTHSHWFLGFAALIIPQDTKSNVHIQYIKSFSMLLLEIQDKGREEHIDLSQYIHTELNFRGYLAQFLLKQSKNISCKIFSDVLDYIYRERGPRYRYESTKYIKELLEQIIVEEDKINSQTFWDLWEILENKIRTTGKRDFISYLFLSIPWWTSEAEDWQPLKQKKIYVRKLITELGNNDIRSVVRLLSGIGTTVLLPDGIIWLKDVIDNTPDPLVELSESNALFYSERLIQKVYYRHLNEIKAHQELRESYLHFLDIMINLGSSLAFIIRERVISV